MEENQGVTSPVAGKFYEHKKIGKIGSDFGCHVLISTAPEKGLSNIYTCAIERINGLNFDLVRRFISKLLNFQYIDDDEFYSYLHPAGGLDVNNQPRRVRCCPHVKLRGRPSDTLVNDINAGRISGMSLIKIEAATPIGGAPYLTRSKSELKLGIDHKNLPVNLWASLSQVMKKNSGTYNTAEVKYRIPDSNRTVTVEIDAATGSPLSEMYILSYELSRIYPFLAQSAMNIVSHLHILAVPQFLANRNI